MLGASCSRDALDGLTLHSKTYQIETAVHTFLSGELAGVSQELAERGQPIGECSIFAKECAIRD